MRFVLLAAAAMLVACTPTFNWREVRIDSADLSTMLPCKPDRGSRQTTMVGKAVELQAIGCETGGATFALMHADLGDAGRTAEALAQWKAATLANMKGKAARETPFVPPGALAIPESMRVVASGVQADGGAVQGEAAYFARGTQVFQAVIYADRLKPELTDSFFSGLKFQ